MRCGERDGVVDNLADLGDDLVGVDGARAVSGGSKRVRNALLRALDGAAGGVVKAAAARRRADVDAEDVWPARVPYRDRHGWDLGSAHTPMVRQRLGALLDRGALNFNGDLLTHEHAARVERGLEIDAEIGAVN